ncbi:protein FAR1-RELATED SEQUENCE 12-like isoform X2 [Durio zibethinus]|uniref:Protein FAR1-RELATED SEQUENCE 12-like isoform X2 n=1 Tax=Durio zibethinus TaxID=66656 RepID=A0A6P5WWG8_DURZI|nr:protein FAR1-RELATED SEQUENCE 12-like isoform X2 [Durio zibethinus]
METELDNDVQLEQTDNDTGDKVFDDSTSKEHQLGNDLQLEQTDKDIRGEVLDTTTNDEHRLGNDGTMAGSSAEDASQVEENDRMTQNSSGVQLTVVEGDEPYVGQEFENEAAAYAFYSAYGMRMGFITRMNYHNRSKIDGSIVSRALVCNKEGYRKPYRRDVKNVRSRAPTRVGCKAMVSIRKMSTGKWVITKFVKEHTHPLAGCEAQRALISNQIPSTRLDYQKFLAGWLVKCLVIACCPWYALLPVDKVYCKILFSVDRFSLGLTVPQAV